MGRGRARARETSLRDQENIPGCKGRKRAWPTGAWASRTRLSFGCWSMICLTRKGGQANQAAFKLARNQPKAWPSGRQARARRNDAKEI